MSLFGVSYPNVKYAKSKQMTTVVNAKPSANFARSQDLIFVKRALWHLLHTRLLKDPAAAIVTRNGHATHGISFSYVYKF